jgi:hypothetical protein
MALDIILKTVTYGGEPVTLDTEPTIYLRVGIKT